MALTQKSVTLVVVAILIALAGLIVVQVSLLRTARDLEAQTFRSSVQTALNKTVRNLETAEAASMAILVAAETNDSLGVKVTAQSFDHRADQAGALAGSSGGSFAYGVGGIFHESSVPTANWVGDTIIYLLPSPQRVSIGLPGSSGLTEKTVLDTALTEGEHRIWVACDLPEHDNLIYRFMSRDTIGSLQKDLRVFDPNHRFGTITMDIEASQAGDSTRYAFVDEIVSRLTMSEKRPVVERISKSRLDSILAASLAESGIPLDYNYGVVDHFSDQLVMANDSSQSDELRTSEFRAGLFPLDFGPSPADLVLFFPGRDLFLWRQIWPIGVATIGLMGVIVLVFGYTIKTISDQRRNAGLMIDFVNNMTHEFKTPISTVALASEAILRSDVIQDKERVARFGQMIQSENRRMRLQAEKILQMAALEEKDHRLKLEPVDFHATIREAVANVSLRVESLQGEVSAELSAADSIVLADPIHLAGIINNLLDNAVKYSEDSPVIKVHSLVVGHHIVVKVSDQGIGLRTEDRKRVFDKYYRVSSGNVHNVKGFGLGLSYVKLMVAAHDGAIEVDSTYGRGTTFRISLPLYTPTEGEESDAG